MKSGARNHQLLTLPDFLSAREKLGEVASYFDNYKSTFKTFKSGILEPQEFRQHIEQILSITLSDAELGCLVTYFDTEKTGKINLIDFVVEFFRLGKVRRKLRTSTYKAKFDHLNDAIQKKKEALLDTIRPKTVIDLPDTWQSDDETNAIRKLTKAAIAYTGNRLLLEVLQLSLKCQIHLVSKC